VPTFKVRPNLQDAHAVLTKAQDSLFHLIGTLPQAGAIEV
jgi:hypothetical protein